MFIRKAYQYEINDLLNMTVSVMSESSMGFVEHNIQNGYQAFVPLLNNGAYYLVAFENNNFAGWVLIGPDFNPINTLKTGSIISLYVLPAFRQLGVGEQLMRAALEELKNEGYQKVHLNVFIGNPAKNLYEKLGFRDISTVMELDI